MKQHDLKIWPEYFDDVANGRKRFEIRKNDRDFSAGDELVLREFDMKAGEYTGRSTTRVVTMVLHGPAFGLADGYVCMGIEGDPQTGDWIAAADVQRLARKLDVAMNGQAGAAKPALVDVVAQACALFHGSAKEACNRGEPLLEAYQKAFAKARCWDAHLYGLRAVYRLGLLKSTEAR